MVVELERAVGIGFVAAVVEGDCVADVAVAEGKVATLLPPDAVVEVELDHHFRMFFTLAPLIHALFGNCKHFIELLVASVLTEIPLGESAKGFGSRGSIIYGGIPSAFDE